MGGGVVRCRCGCNDVVVEGVGYRCGDCGRYFREKQVVVYVTPVEGGAVCPECGVKLRVTSSPKAVGRTRVRQHRCLCGWTGPSVEKVG